MDVFQPWFEYLKPIMNILFIVILVLMAALAIITFLSKRKMAHGLEDSSDLENTLRRVLENTEIKAAKVDAASIGEPIVGLDESSDDELRSQLTEKIHQIEELKSQMSAMETAASTGGVVSAASGAEVTALENKVNELEAKLAEYEIIEDDIANLSLYKEENVRLKDELSKLKSGQAPAPEPAEAKEPEPQPAPEPEPEPAEAKEPEEEDIMAEFAQAVEDQKSATAEAKETPSVEEEMADLGLDDSSEENDFSEADDDIMAEFAQAVDEQKAVDSEAKTEMPEQVASTAEPETEVDAQDGADDDIMAEFAQAVDEQQVAQSDTPSEPEPIPEAPADALSRDETPDEADLVPDNVMDQFQKAVGADDLPPLEEASAEAAAESELAASSEPEPAAETETTSASDAEGLAEDVAAQVDAASDEIVDDGDDIDLGGMIGNLKDELGEDFPGTGVQAAADQAAANRATAPPAEEKVEDAPETIDFGDDESEEEGPVVEEASEPVSDSEVQAAAEPEAAVEAEAAIDNILGDPDPDQILNEMDDLMAAAEEDDGEDEDNPDKLISEFENLGSDS